MASTTVSLRKVLMDLGQGDVHVTSAPSKRPSMKTLEDLKKALAAKEITQEEFDAKKKLLDDSGGEGADMTAGGTTTDCGDQQVECTAHGDGVVIEMKSAETETPIWIQVAKQGAFRGHAAGHFKMDAGTFTEIIANFNAQANKFIPVDFEHASEQHPTEGSIPHTGAPAQGWITALELRADGNLWGLVTWGDIARGYIKKGQYKFLSPAIVFGAKDRVTGKPVGARLSSVALTNNPFLDGMQPVAAKRNDAVGVVDMTALTAIREALELPTYVNEGVLLSTLSSLEVGEGQVGAADVRTRAAKLRESLRLPLTMSSKDVFNQARIACGAITPPAPLPVVTKEPATAEGSINMAGEDKKDTEISSLTVKLGAAEARVTTLTTEHTVAMKAVTDENAALKLRIEEFETKEIATLVDGAMNVWGEKKGLTADSRPHLMRMAKNDREGFVALFPPVTPGSAAKPHHGKIVAATNHVVTPNNVPVEGQLGTVVNMNQVVAGVPSHEDLAAKFITEAKALGKNMSREEAFSKAFTERKTLITAAAQKALAGNGG